MCWGSSGVEDVTKIWKQHFATLHSSSVDHGHQSFFETKIADKLLFSKLIDSNNSQLCCAATRLLAFWYSHQQVFVRWQNNYSQCFNLARGVRQGGILSPYLFKLKASVEQEVNVHRSEIEKNAFKVFKLKQFVSCLILTLSSQGRYRWV